MYNRYIPQSDGTYLRSRVAEPIPHPAPRTEKAAACPEEDKSQPPLQLPPRPCGGTRPPRKVPKPVMNHKQSPAGDFLKNLLPKEIDTSDLMIILLLLLMAGDNPEEQSNALLTLALYLFL